MNQNKKHKVVFQFNTNTILEQKALLTYVNNVKKHWEDLVEIDVVVHGPGIDMLLVNKTMVGESLGNVMKRGIVFYACENTLEARKISKENIIQGVEFVPSGLVTIIERQEAGWAYIKCNL